MVGARRRRRAGWRGSLTWAHVLLLLYVRHVEAPQVHGSHAECELADGPPLSQPVREPGQVAVAVQVVGVEAPRRGTDRGKTLSQHEGGGGCHWLDRGAPLPSVIILRGPGQHLPCTTELPSHRWQLPSRAGHSRCMRPGSEQVPIS